MSAPFRIDNTMSTHDDDNMLLTDVYSLPHKALRAALGDAGTALGAADHDIVTVVAGDVVTALDELCAHAEHEDTFIQPVIERYLPDIAVEVAAQHTALHRQLDGVRRQLHAAVREPTGLTACYRSYQRLVAQNLHHLDHEESIVLPALWLATPPTALSDVMDRFRSAHPEAVELYRRHRNALTTGERTMVDVAA